jgi:hypothetical protein
MSVLVICPCCGVRLRLEEEDGRHLVLEDRDRRPEREVKPGQEAARRVSEGGPRVDPLVPESSFELPVFRLDPSRESSAEDVAALAVGIDPPEAVAGPDHTATEAQNAALQSPDTMELTIAALGLDRSAEGGASSRDEFTLESHSSEYGVPVAQRTAVSHQSPTPPPRCSREPRRLAADRARPTSWGTVILAAYAGFLTLAFTWLYFSGRIVGRRTSTASAVPARSSRSIVAADMPQSPLPAIPAELKTGLGTPVRVGEIEVTPIDIMSRGVSLQNVVDPEQWRDEDDEALWLRLRVRNLSLKSHLTPIEPRFVRQPDRGMPESLIETGAKPIYPYPLAFASEWEISGQKFPELRPGEEQEILIVSEPGVEDRLAARMTWRVRIRTRADQTELIGIEFGQHELK